MATRKKTFLSIIPLLFAACVYTPESTPEADKIVASWTLIESYDYCSKSYTANPDTSKAIHHTDTFLVITRDSIYWYDKGSCKKTVTTPDSLLVCSFADWFCGPYSLSNDSLKGDMWEGSIAYNGGTFSWYTTLSVTSQKLTLVRYALSDSAAGNIHIWRKRVFE